MLEGGISKFTGVIVSFLVIVFFYAQAVEYSTITYENWAKAISFLVGVKGG